MAQLTLNIPDAQVPRITTAFGATLGPQPFTAPDLKSCLMNYIKAVVSQYESDRDGKVAKDTAAANVASQITIT